MSSESDTEESSTLEKLRWELHKTNNNNMRRRQLTVMLQNVESTNKAASECCLAHRRSFLVDLGVFDQTQANNAKTDPDAPLLGHIEQAKEKKIQCEQEEKIKRAFGNPWLVQLEKEMVEESERMEDSTDKQERKVMKSLLEINCEKLRSYHNYQRTLNLAAAVEQRKRLCLSNGLVDPSCVHLIRDLYSPVPVLTSPASITLTRPKAVEVTATATTKNVGQRHQRHQRTFRMTMWKLSVHRPQELLTTLQQLTQ